MDSRVYFSLITFWICLALHADLDAQDFSLSNYTVKRFTPADGLGFSHTRGITQDSLGYIWIASSGGLSSYDGYNFKVHKFDPDTLRSDVRGGITSLSLDRAGQLWIISEILSKYDRTADNFIYYKPDLDLTRVLRFCFEKNGPVVWMGTFDRGLYSFNIETQKTSNYLNEHPDSLTKAMRNFILGIGDRDTYLLIATQKGLWKFDKAKRIFTRPQCDPKDSAFLYNASIWDIIDGPKYDFNETWLALQTGLVKVNEELSIVQRFDYPAGYEPDLRARDKDGVFWSLTLKNNLLLRFDPKDGLSRFIEIKTGREPFAFRSQIFFDRNLNIWSGSETDGAFQLIPKNLVFHNFTFPERGSWSASTLYKAKETERLVLIYFLGNADNHIWTARPILTESPDSVEFRELEMKTPLRGITMSATTGKKTLWICSWRDGITGIPISPVTGLIQPDKRFKLGSDPLNPNTISNEQNVYVLEDQAENLWVSSRIGISKIVASKPYGTEGSIERYKHVDQDSNSLNDNFGVKFYPEDENSLWVFTWTGVDLFRNGKFEHILRSKETPWSLLKTSDGSLLIGTTSGFYQATKTGDHYSVQENARLKKYGVYNLQEDLQGRLWLTDAEADRLVCYDRKDKVAIELNQHDGLPTGITNFLQTSKGIMVLVSVHGFTLFDPLALQTEKAGIHPTLTGLTVNNQVPVIESKAPKSEFSIKSHVGVLDELVLDYLHNNFSIEFSAMEMTSPDKNLNRHKLEGFDQDWIETDYKNRTATYTNLDAGTYTFRVKASNHHGVWSDQERTLLVKILPPPWKTWWAYTGYSLIVAGFLFAARKMIVQRERLKANLNLAKVEQEKEHFELEKAKEVDQLKSRFFANISHEFRTPITLVLGPLKDHYKQLSNPEQKNIIGSVIRNGQRLQRLINQLLDLSKVEAGKMELRSFTS